MKTMDSKRGLAGLTVSLLIFSLFVTLGISTVAATAPSVSIDPALTENLCPGDTFHVTVTVNSSTYNLRAVSMDLVYNSTVLQVNEITVSGPFTSYLTEPGSGDDGAGTIHYGIANTEGTYRPSAGTFITVEFEVKAGAADGNYALALQNVVLKDENNDVIPGVTVTDGEGVVECYDDAPIINITNPANGTTVKGTVTINVTDLSGEDDIAYCLIEYLNGSAWNEICNHTAAPYTCDWDTTAVPNRDYIIKARMVDLSGQSGTDVITVTVENPICGDVNGDRIVDMDDVFLLLEHVGNKDGYEAIKDMNCDGEVNMGDVILLLNHAGDPATYELGCCQEA